MRMLAFAVIATLASQSSATFVSATITPNASQDRRGTRFGPDGEFRSTNVTLTQLVENAYRRHGFDRRGVTGGPEWATTTRFDVVAQAPHDHVFEASGFPRETLDMLKQLLADRFGLRLHVEMRLGPLYALETVMPGRLGPRLTPSHDDCAAYMRMIGRGERPATPQCGASPYPGRLAATGISLDDLAGLLSGLMDRPVVNRTGLEGLFDLDLEANEFQPPGPFGPSYRPSDTKVSIHRSMPEQLGLKLVPINGEVEVIVIDEAKPPGVFYGFQSGTRSLPGPVVSF